MPETIRTDAERKATFEKKPEKPIAWIILLMICLNS
jgi:hypothetical protein